MPRAQLTPECTDLLNKIFVIDEKKRITVQEIQGHPWYQRPLLPKYAAAEAEIASRQRQVEDYIRRRDLNIVRAPLHNPVYALYQTPAQVRGCQGRDRAAPAPGRGLHPPARPQHRARTPS